MKFCYYPGCTLKTKAKELDIYARKSAEALGVELEELKDWQCCGAVYPMASDEIATKLSAVRALMAARDENCDLITLCSACHHVIKRVNADMAENADINLKVNNYLKNEIKYKGETKVVHYLEMLRDYVGFDNIKKAVKNPFTGKKIAAYYGCLLLRPSKVLHFDNPENPTIMEDFIKSISATPVIFPYRNECCGGYITLEDECSSKKKSKTVIDSALECGADCIITACPLCLYNLSKVAKDRIPVIYFTELLAEALGVKE